MNPLRACAGLGFLFFALVPAYADTAPIIHYAPTQNLEHIDVGLIDGARKEIDFAAYVLTDWPVMQALSRAARRGVKVRIYMDSLRQGGPEPSPPFRALLGDPLIGLRVKRAGAPLMHLKSYQIDHRLLRTGSANFSASGLKRQDNDLVVMESRAAAAAFVRRFEAIYAKGQAVHRF
jgi:phosphatidylserine/phosphatidylglycerophosphate/cardiolipin synthase-like enzyme